MRHNSKKGVANKKHIEIQRGKSEGNKRKADFAFGLHCFVLVFWRKVCEESTTRAERTDRYR